jgi:glycosyltransferase involved in cell wall biosynthesis
MSQLKDKKIAIVGIVGIPANYGGFETLAENLVKYHYAVSLPDSITVYCSTKSYPRKITSYYSARLRYVPLNANGAQSIPYDIWSLFYAVWNRNDEILLLGVSGAFALPLVRFVSSARIVTNIDGIEWRREKWQGLTKRFLQFSERIAVRFSDVVIADNAAIAEYVRETYGVECSVIAYGGDHAMTVEAIPIDEYALPGKYAISVCRIEPENHTQLIVETFSRQDAISLVIVGNWNNSEYGRAIRTQYSGCSHIFLLDPIYDLGKLKTLRSHALFYVHGHSAGGTNPSLVEAMHFAKPILAFDCNFNRATTEDKALFFTDGDSLLNLIGTIDATQAERVGRDMQEIAKRRYTWQVVAGEYFSLLQNQRGTSV